MLINRVERYRIPIVRAWGEARPEMPPKEGTTVAELIEGLQKLPPDGIVSTDFNGGDVIVMHYKPDIDSTVDPVLESMRKALGLS
ncbi:hypothetical protein SEA_BIANCATRI92_45 [Mycobacterium phage BiancaTri92]|nr:hypothetical protein SEA_LEOGANIA_45 [Mycobacterium phage Leogania]QGJ90945.1 hypothetical protein SEA_BIANCATRI92_45 [Mycobacterium phage BiancaTri92]